ncbi:hypothetical protein HPB51_028960 [Rhipicephalus microplus]|uniref:Cytosolic endo-beta-N-acetylglucosaminidase TIM barrel domain-containing protein n=1 Tax=Rhipicephalus microplus TaxID=6941 RepID=A0A9J6CVL2_RHIMP|nr:hypothetical protein HPB51_028960 [Rhipicephalus microplus]
MLLNSARVAGDRKADVYAGVDVYARETWYPGGYDMYKAVQLARRCGLSAAIFAAGWVYETQDEKNFAANQRRDRLYDAGCGHCRRTAARSARLRHFPCPQRSARDAVPVCTTKARLFGFDLPLGSLCVSYAFKNKQQGTLAGHDVNLILRVRDVVGKEDELSLSSVIVVPQSEKYIVEREITDSAQGDLSLAQGGWLTRSVTFCS